MLSDLAYNVSDCLLFCASNSTVQFDCVSTCFFANNVLLNDEMCGQHVGGVLQYVHSGSYECEEHQDSSNS